MRKITETLICDICKTENSNCEQIKYPVLFFTEQTEGKTCDPYISCETIDCCPGCKNKILKVVAHGAQGINRYQIRGGLML
jgi:hypothetical protein